MIKLLEKLLQLKFISVSAFVCFRGGLWQPGGGIILQYLLHRHTGLGFSISLLLFQP